MKKCVTRRSITFREDGEHDRDWKDTFASPARPRGWSYHQDWWKYFRSKKPSPSIHRCWSSCFPPRKMITDLVRSLINCITTKAVSCLMRPKQRSLRRHNRWDRLTPKVRAGSSTFFFAARLQPISVLYSVFISLAFKISSVIPPVLSSLLNSVTFSFRCHCLHSFVLANWHRWCPANSPDCRPLQCMRMWN